MNLQGYLSLITSEHRGAPDYIATVTLTMQPFVDNEALSATIPGLYDIDVAVGEQLDVVGVWVGQSRFIAIPLSGVYFTWADASLGWGFGTWKGPFDPSQGLTRLDDATYRLLLYARIAANNWDGTMPGAAAALADLFNGSTTPGAKLWIQDTLNMTMKFVISGQIPSAVFQAIFAEGLIPLRPSGVSATYWVTSVDGAPVFAWGMDNPYGAGWGIGAWATQLFEYSFATPTNLANNGGVVELTNGAGWPTSPTGLPAGYLWNNGGIISVVPGVVPDPFAAPVFFGSITSGDLLALGGGNLPLTNPGTHSFQLWNNGGVVCIDS